LSPKDGMLVEYKQNTVRGSRNFNMFFDEVGNLEGDIAIKKREVGHRHLSP
jgi:hypothetical protein